MLRYASLLGVAAAQTSTISNVVCNGATIAFDVAVTSGNGPTMFKFNGCESGHNVDKTGSVTTGAKSGVANTYEVSFDPYGQCEGAADPNDATSYGVDMSVIMSFQANVGGQDVFVRGEEVTLTCNFQSEYTATADLGQISVPANEYPTVASTAFGIGIEMDRYTDSGYGSVATIPANPVIAYEDIFFQVEGDTAFTNTNFILSVSEVKLEKMASGNTSVDKSLTLFDHTASDACTAMDALGFAFTLTLNQRQQFKYKAFFLDDATDATYRVSVKAQACGSGATNSQCTRSRSCVA